MTIFYSQSLNAYFDSEVTPLDQMPADIVADGSPIAIETIAEIEAETTTKKKG